MPLINTSIPNLAQGVSQQPDNLRFPGQGEAQVNGYSSVVDGLKKRPFTQFVGELGTDTPISEDSFVHFINRGSGLQHLLVIEPNATAPKIYNITDGTSLNVYDALTNTNPPNVTYISNATPKDNLTAITVADTTYILNKTQTISASGTNSAAVEKKAAIFVKQGDYAKDFHVDVTIGDETYHATYKSNDGQNANSELVNGTLPTAGEPGEATIKNGASTEMIAQGVFGALLDLSIPDCTITLANLDGLTGSGPSYANASNAGSILIEYTGSETTFHVGVHDGIGGLGLGIVGQSVTGLTDLPKISYTGLKVQVKGDIELNQDDYYVRFLANVDGEYDGTVKQIKVTNVGSSYTSAPTVTISAPDSGTTATATANLDGNNVTSITITNPGSGYTSSPTVTISGGGGADATAVAILQPYSDGIWIETIAPDTPTALDATELPYIIRPQSDPNQANYCIITNTWGTREVGDTTTNPDPSFVGNTIENIFFWKNRLGLLSGQNILFSEADEYGNFFRSTVLQLLDSAPIDVGVSHTKVSFLKHAAAFQEKLIVFSEETQFVIKGNELLTPKTINISPVTEYIVSSKVRPLGLGQFIYFPFTRNSFGAVNEYFLDVSNDNMRADEITEHIPKYIVGEIRHMAGTNSEDCIVCLGSNLKEAYVYKYFWRGTERIQSSWSKFTFGNDIVSAFFLESDLYLVTKDDTRTHLEKMSLESGLVDSGLDYSIHLDKRISVSSCSPSYDAGTDKTTFTAPYEVDDTGFEAEVWSQAGVQPKVDSRSGNTIVVNGDYSSSAYIGIPYQFSYTFTRPTLKQPSVGGGRAASVYTKETLRTGSLEFANTGHFIVNVASKYRPTYEHIYNPTILGADLVLGVLTVQDGFFRFPIYAAIDDITISVTSNSALPVQLLAAEFESHASSRSRRYGG